LLWIAGIRKAKQRGELNLAFRPKEGTTHDEGGITEKDFSLVRQCDEVFSKFFLS